MKLVSSSAPLRLVVDNGETCEEVLRRLADVHCVAVDCETNLGPPWIRRAVTVQLSWANVDVVVLEPYLTHLRPWITANRPIGIFYGAKGDLWALSNAGLSWPGPVHDAMVVDYLLNENAKIKDFEAGLKERHAEVFNHEERLGYKQLFSVRGKGLLGADEVLQTSQRQQLLDYAMADSRDTWEFYWHQRTKLEKIPWVGDESLFDYFVAIEAPFTQVLYYMERKGVLIDDVYLQTQQKSAEQMLVDIERDFYREVRNAVGSLEGLGFSYKLMTSPQQLKKLFYEVLKYPPQRNFDKVKREERLTTDEDALERLSARGAKLPKLLLHHRQIKKLKGTYLDGLLERLSPWKRIHTDFIQSFTLTGRLSSRDPNLQNIPRPENDPFKIRRAFIAPPGMSIMSFDYSQVEMRVMAHMSGDEAMIRACEASDIYSAVASEIANVPIEFFAKGANGERTPEAEAMRQGYKAIALGVGFGKQAESIARDLGISVEQATEWLKKYFAKFSRFNAWMKKQIRECRDRGYVRTLSGRYRRIPEIRSDNWIKRSHAERQALNSPIQGGARDILVRAMLNIYHSNVLEEYGANMVLTVHDELLFEVPTDVVDAFREEIRHMMLNPFTQPLSVKLAVSGGVALNWGDAKH